MRYESGAAFRRALEERLRQQSLRSGAPLVCLRKTVALLRETLPGAEICRQSVAAALLDLGDWL